jgi:hypothetical protein
VFAVALVQYRNCLGLCLVIHIVTYLKTGVLIVVMTSCSKDCTLNCPYLNIVLLTVSVWGAYRL